MFNHELIKQLVTSFPHKNLQTTWEVGLSDAQISLFHTKLQPQNKILVTSHRNIAIVVYIHSVPFLVLTATCTVH